MDPYFLKQFASVYVLKSREKEQVSPATLDHFRTKIQHQYWTQRGRLTMCWLIFRRIGGYLVVLGVLSEKLGIWVLHSSRENNFSIKSSCLSSKPKRNKWTSSILNNYTKNWSKLTANRWLVISHFLTCVYSQMIGHFEVRAWGLL